MEIETFVLFFNVSYETLKDITFIISLSMYDSDWHQVKWYWMLISVKGSHSGIIFQLGYISGYIGNPFSPLFYPHHSEYSAPFHLMWPRINNQ